jgi:HAD superfamily hydrolase (TIGR01509 family)
MILWISRDLTMFEAVIFDWDGTLADTRAAIVFSHQKVLRDIGCTVTDESLEKQIGIGARNMLTNALRSSDIPYDEKLIDSLMERKNKIHAELADRITLFNGVTDLLDSLRPRVKIALATMSSRTVINKLLKEKGVRGYFDFVISADEVQDPKPHPEAFLKCAEQLKCPPQRCVVIEDSIFGVTAAKKANMKCIAVPSGAYSEKELQEEKPNLIVNSISERDRILQFIFAGS